MICEMCGHDAMTVYRRWCAYLRWTRDVDEYNVEPRGDGRGWMVTSPVSIRTPMLIGDVIRYEHEGVSCYLAYRIFTCGDPVCTFRARHHGLPGRDQHRSL